MASAKTTIAQARLAINAMNNMYSQASAGEKPVLEKYASHLISRGYGGKRIAFKKSKIRTKRQAEEVLSIVSSASADFKKRQKQILQQEKTYQKLKKRYGVTHKEFEDMASILGDENFRYFIDVKRFDEGISGQVKELLQNVSDSRSLIKAMSEIKRITELKGSQYKYHGESIKSTRLDSKEFLSLVIEFAKVEELGEDSVKNYKKYLRGRYDGNDTRLNKLLGI